MDIKVISALGLHGACAATCITVQNTRGIQRVISVDPSIVEEMIDVLRRDLDIRSVKTGALPLPRHVEIVAELVEDTKIPLVVDPVMRAKDGTVLTSDESIEVMKRRLLPIATVVTPNAEEVKAFVGEVPRSVEDAKRLARKIAEQYGVKVVVVKGGHLEELRAIDVAYVDGTYILLEKPREPRVVRGTGCCFSAALASALAMGMGIEEALRLAKNVTYLAIAYAYRVSDGPLVPATLASLEIDVHAYRSLSMVQQAVEEILRHGEVFKELVPEVGTNVVYAYDPRYVRSIDDVASIEGRIVKTRRGIVVAGRVAMGGSSHVARALLKAMELDPTVRAAMNLKPHPKLIEGLRRLGKEVVFIDRREEPEEIRRVEGASIPWIVEEAFRRAGKLPTAIYDAGDVGKEPMLRLFARDPTELVKLVLKAMGIEEQST